MSSQWSSILGVLLFERVHGGRKLNFIHAIAQCCTGFSEILSGDLPSCSTLQEAVSIIETNSSLRKLKRYLTANVKTFLKCHSCGNTSDALVSSSNQTFIFKASESGQSIARPIVPDSDLNNNVERTCDSCESTSNGVQLEISKQIFLEPPQCLLVSMSFLIVLRWSSLYRKTSQVLPSILFSFAVKLGVLSFDTHVNCS